MSRKFIPSLRYNEFEDEYTPNHYHTGNDFFTIDKTYNIYEPSNKKAKYYQDHVSEFSQIIPENMNYFDNRKIYKNNIFIETKDLSPNNNFLYTSKHIHLEDMNYQKYLLNIKDENSNRKKMNKKNNSQNKNNSNSETYNIIQIYEAPPLELTPISENEKNEFLEKRKPPKYFRKKKDIFSRK